MPLDAQPACTQPPAGPRWQSLVEVMQQSITHGSQCCGRFHLLLQSMFMHVPQCLDELNISDSLQPEIQVETKIIVSHVPKGTVQSI